MTYLRRDQIRSIDQRAIDEYGIPGLVLMENAGRGCADVLDGIGIQGVVVICCGKGNNGGDGFVIARHLDARGYTAKVLLWAEPSELAPDAASNHQTLVRSGVSTANVVRHEDPTWLQGQLRGADWIVDCLLGTGARGEPRPPFDQAITSMNACTANKLAIDLPSGLDCDTGQPASVTFRADHTCTLVAEKAGFQYPAARPFVGTVHVVDIGLPRQLRDASLT